MLFTFFCTGGDGNVTNNKF